MGPQALIQTYSHLSHHTQIIAYYHNPFLTQIHKRGTKKKYLPSTSFYYTSLKNLSCNERFKEGRAHFPLDNIGHVIHSLIIFKFTLIL